MDEAIHVIEDHADRLFLWDYERERGQLVTLYNKAMASQWSSVTDLDWSIDVDPEKLGEGGYRSHSSALSESSAENLAPGHVVVSAAVILGFAIAHD